MNLQDIVPIAEIVSAISVAITVIDVPDFLFSFFKLSENA